MKASRSGCSAAFALFGLPFAVAGLGLTGLMYFSVFRWVSVQSWVETPAVLLDVEVTQRETTGTEATYEYEWLGEKHIGHVVSLSTGRDNVGEFQERVAFELTDHHKKGKPFRCFVNPGDPSQAILYRELRWQMLSFMSVFGTIFTTIGCGIVIASALSIPDARKTEELRKQFPRHPWRWKKEWAEGYVSRQDHSNWVAWTAGWWVFVTVPGGIGATNALFHGNIFGLFGLVLPGLSLLIVRAAVRGRIRRARFGESRIELDRFPMFTGGVNGGRLLIQNNVASPSSWKFQLECEVTRGSGEDSYKTTIFEAAVAYEGCEPGEGWGGAAVPFEFQLPANARQTDLEDSSVEWKLTVTGTTGDARYEAGFEMPVFETKDSNPKFMTSSESQPDDRYPADSDEELLKNGLLIREAIDGGLTVIAPARRNIPVKIVLGLFCLIWDGICVLIWLQEAPWLFRIAFPAAGAIITLVWIDLLLRSSRFHVDSHEFSWRNGWPLLAREQRVEASEVTSVEAKTSMQSGNTQYYKIVVSFRSRKPAKVLSLIRGKSAADSLVSRIQGILTEGS